MLAGERKKRGNESRTRGKGVSSKNDSFRYSERQYRGTGFSIDSTTVFNGGTSERNALKAL